MGSSEAVFFGIFLVFIGGMLAIDLGLFSTKNHKVSFKEAGIWSAVWVSLALLFYVFISSKGHLIHGIDNMQELVEIEAKYSPATVKIDASDYEKSLKYYNRNLGLEFITGYLIEYALSVDNIFVIILIFTGFGVSELYFKRVLFWGIIGAVVMRCIFIFVGSALIHQFSWILQVFGLLLLFTGIKMFMARNKEDKIETENHPIVKFTSRYMKVHPVYVAHRFFVKADGVWKITPLFIVLLIIEFTDLLFAIDSVPAVFSITKDPYIVFFSNIFAILGLRSMFFFLSNVMHLFHYLKIGLCVLLCFIGLKMIFDHWLEKQGFTTAYSLYIVLGILALSILASVLFPEKKKDEAPLAKE
jgi:tellurite resistance protein TerC